MSENVYPIHKRLWKCDGCGRVDEWGLGWEWFGSLLTAEENIPPVVSCSPRCRDSEGVAKAKDRQEKLSKAAMRRIRRMGG